MKKKLFNINYIKKNLNEDGYCVLKNFVKQKDIKKILGTLALNFSNEIGNLINNKKKITGKILNLVKR